MCSCENRRLTYGTGKIISQMARTAEVLAAYKLWTIIICRSTVVGVVGPMVGPGVWPIVVDGLVMGAAVAVCVVAVC